MHVIHYRNSGVTNRYAGMRMFIFGTWASGKKFSFPTTVDEVDDHVEMITDAGGIIVKIATLKEAQTSEMNDIFNHIHHINQKRVDEIEAQGGFEEDD